MITHQRLGPPKVFLGNQSYSMDSVLFLNQRKYSLDILTESGRLGTRSSHFPMEQNHKLAVSFSALFLDPERYRHLVGQLSDNNQSRSRLSTACFSTIFEGASTRSLGCSSESITLLEAILGTRYNFYDHICLSLMAYCDSDWISCPLTRRSITCFITLGGCPISWKTKKQTTISRSTAEAEYRAMATTISELIWLRGLLSCLGVELTRPIKLFCDNQAALHIATNLVFHERTKHIEIDCHFVR